MKKLIGYLLVVCIFFVGTISVYAISNDELVEQLRDNGVIVYEANAVEYAPKEQSRAISVPPNQNMGTYILPTNAVSLTFDFDGLSIPLYSDRLIKIANSSTPIRMSLTTASSSSGVFDIYVYDAFGSLVKSWTNQTVHSAVSSEVLKVEESILSTSNKYYIEVHHVSGGEYLGMVVY